MRGIPKFQEELLERSEKGNFSLYFFRMTSWQEDGNGCKKDDAAIVNLGQKAIKLFRGVKDMLAQIHNRQKALLTSIAEVNGFQIEIRAKLITPFVSGLGSGHPTETGMILDRNTGLPYIPASAIKGVLRLAHALELAEKKPDVVKQNGKGEYEISDREPTLRKYFGDTDTSAKDAVRGQLVFLDAFPASVPEIKTDIMNPHYGSYYKGAEKGKENSFKGPIETDNPIPVKFLAVKEGIEFIFRVFALPLGIHEGASIGAVERTFGQKDKDAVIAMLDRAFRELGFGGKTSVGYGRMERIKSADTPTPKAEQTDICWEGVNVFRQPSDGSLVASGSGNRKAQCKKEIAQKIMEKLSESDRNKLRKKGLSGVKVRVRSVGNAYELVEIVINPPPKSV